MKKEIDVVDLILDWIEHWKSLLVAVLVGVVLACSYMFLFSESEPIHESQDEETIEELAKVKMLSELSQEQLQSVSLKEMEEFFLSEKDIASVDDVIYLQGEYENNVKVYDEKKDGEKLRDRAEAFSHIANTKNIVEARRASLTGDQQIYYYAKLGLDSSVGNGENKTNELIINSGNSLVRSKKKAVLIIFLVLLLHFVIIGLRYIFGQKIKHADVLSNILDVPEFTRMVDWESINNTRGIGKFVNKVRFSSFRQTELKETISINVATTIDILKKKKYSSLAVVGSGIDVERLTFISQIAETDSSIIVKSLDSVAYSVNGAENIAGVDAAILVARVGLTKYNELVEEFQSLKTRKVDVIGIMVFE